MKEEVSGQPLRVQQCPECGSTRLMRDYECAEIVCMNCGFVVAAKLADRGPEWRAFDDEQRAKRARVGAPLTFTIHDKGLSTMIDWHDRDVYGKGLSPGQKAQIYPEYVCARCEAICAARGIRKSPADVARINGGD